MAPNFDNVARRLRPEWVRDWLLRPGNWLPYTKMTAFWATTDRPKSGLWPEENDPFLSPTPAWNLVPGPASVTGEQQAEMVRDFLFSLPPDAAFPATVADVPNSPLVRKVSPEQLKAEADAADKDKKDKKKDDKKVKPRRTGQSGVPARF